MKQFITEAERLQKLAGIDEIKIYPSSFGNINSLTSPVSRHPDLLNFVKSNLRPLMNYIISELNNEALEEWNINPDDLSNIKIHSENAHEYYKDSPWDDEVQYYLPYGQDIEISTPEMDDKGAVIVIANHPIEYSEGYVRPLEKFKGLYWDVVNY